MFSSQRGVFKLIIFIHFKNISAKIIYCSKQILLFFSRLKFWIFCRWLLSPNRSSRQVMEIFFMTALTVITVVKIMIQVLVMLCQKWMIKRRYKIWAARYLWLWFNWFKDSVVLLVLNKCGQCSASAKFQVLDKWYLQSFCSLALFLFFFFF